MRKLLVLTLIGWTLAASVSIGSAMEREQPAAGSPHIAAVVTPAAGSRQIATTVTPDFAGTTQGATSILIEHDRK
jgi:hypothetical protein